MRSSAHTTVNWTERDNDIWVKSEMRVEWTFKTYFILIIWLCECCNLMTYSHFTSQLPQLPCTAASSLHVANRVECAELATVVMRWDGLETCMWTVGNFRDSNNQKTSSGQKPQIATAVCETRTFEICDVLIYSIMQILLKHGKLSPNSSTSPNPFARKNRNF